ncbi:hypothetical protein BKA66DRAFT_565860 [Pyrenochaeta sp. MPI-SDFR-AT-0127]|nr:hypothetical protein BKA66DRAFT_565860 [Pyrenochaeta sp. MPI-SDFR-AT-0127]
MAKRAFESAFTSSTMSGMLVTTNGFDAPQPQVQHIAPPSPDKSLYIPGQWPLETNSRAPQEPPRAGNTTLFTTIGNWAATVANVTNLFTLPQRIAQHFLRRQKILAVPVVRADGSNKKRFVDAGLAGEQTTPSPSLRARANASRRRFQPATSLSPDIWSPSPSPVQPHESRQATTSAVDDTSEDESLDFSFSDVLTSTPPRNFQTGSPVPVSWDIPEAHTQIGSPSPSPLSHNLKDVIESTTAHKVQNNSGLDAPPVTPMRRHLLKLQLRALTELQEAEEEHLPEAETAPLTPTKLSDEDLSDLPIASSSPFETDVSSSPFQSLLSSSPFQSVLSSSPLRLEPSAGAPPPYDNDLSFLSDAPLPLRKSVRWAQHAGAKPFFVDERVSEMLDSTLETIVSSPVKPSWQQYDEAEDSSEDDDQTTNEDHSDPESGLSAVTSGSHGVTAKTSDSSDDSIDESQISVELLEDLQEDLKKKLALEPPPPPPLKPLVTPLSSEEMGELNDIAVQTDHGRNSNAYVIPEKLYARDFGTLLPDQFNGDPKAWLNDNIVNEYLSILVSHIKKEAGFEHKRGGPAPPVHAFSSFWYSTIKDRPKSVERWAARFQLGGHQYLEANLVLYPICDGGHWRLLAVKPRERMIEYLDSLGFSGIKYVAKLKEYLAKELGDAWIEEDWTVVELQRSNRQLNGSDCGVFTLLNALTLLRGEEAQRVVASCGMLDARERIATTLVAGKPTTEWE